MLKDVGIEVPKKYRNKVKVQHGCRQRHNGVATVGPGRACALPKIIDASTLVLTAQYMCRRAARQW